MLVYYLDKFHEVEHNTITILRNPSKLLRLLTALDTSIIKVHVGALIILKGHIIAELWVEAKSGLLRALVSDHNKASLLRLWDKIDRPLKEDYEHFIGISLEIREVGLANEIVELVMHESRKLEEEVELLSRIQASELLKVRKFIHLQPWGGLLILELDDEVSIYKASRVALKQAIPEIERRYKLEVEVLDKSFLEA